MDEKMKSELINALLSAAAEDTEMSIRKLNIGAMGLGSAKNEHKDHPAARIEKVTQAFEFWDEQKTLKKGDLLQLKDKSFRLWRMKDDEILVVMEVLPKPIPGWEIEPNAGPGDIYFSLTYDCICGFYDDTGIFVQWLLDSRRFRKYKKPASNVTPIKQ